MGRLGLSKVLGRLTLLACDLLPGTRTDIRRLIGSAAISSSKRNRGRPGPSACIAPRSTAGGSACERLRCIAGCRGWFLTLIQLATAGSTSRPNLQACQNRSGPISLKGADKNLVDPPRHQREDGERYNGSCRQVVCSRARERRKRKVALGLGGNASHSKLAVDHKPRSAKNVRANPRKLCCLCRVSTAAQVEPDLWTTLCPCRDSAWAYKAGGHRCPPWCWEMSYQASRTATIS